MSKKKSQSTRPRSKSKQPQQALFEKRAAIVRRLGTGTSILGIRMISGQFQLRSVPPDFKAKMGFHENHMFNEATRKLGVHLTFEFTALPPTEQPVATSVQVGASYLVDYQLAPQLAVDEEALRLFCRVNAAYNVWPYWREFIHQSLVRLELPPMTAQLLRVDDLLRAYSPENGATAPTGTPGSG